MSRTDVASGFIHSRHGGPFAMAPLRTARRRIMLAGLPRQPLLNSGTACPGTVMICRLPKSLKVTDDDVTLK